MTAGPLHFPLSTMSADEALDVQRSLGRIEGKIDGLVEGYRIQMLRANSHSLRLTKLETWRTRSMAYLIGGTTVISVVATGVYHFLFLTK